MHKTGSFSKLRMLEALPLLPLPSNNGTIIVPSLLIAHMSFAVLSFGILLPVGAAVALLHSREASLRKSNWFKIHWQLQTVGSLFALIMLVLGALFSESKGLGHVSTPHQALGITAVTMLFLQVINGFFRPHFMISSEGFRDTTKIRGFWEYLHRLSAAFALSIGIFNLFLGPFAFVLRPNGGSGARVYCTGHTSGMLASILLLGAMAVRLLRKNQAAIKTIDLKNQIVKLSIENGDCQDV